MVQAVGAGGGCGAEGLEPCHACCWGHTSASTLKAEMAWHGVVGRVVPWRTLAWCGAACCAVLCHAVLWHAVT